MNQETKTIEVLLDLKKPEETISFEVKSACPLTEEEWGFVRANIGTCVRNDVKGIGPKQNANTILETVNTIFNKITGRDALLSVKKVAKTR